MNKLGIVIWGLILGAAGWYAGSEGARQFVDIGNGERMLIAQIVLTLIAADIFARYKIAEFLLFIASLYGGLCLASFMLDEAAFRAGPAPGLLALLAAAAPFALGIVFGLLLRRARRRNAMIG